MARPLRIQLEGGIFYVTFSGSEGKTLFRKESDYLQFLEKLAGQLELRGVRLHAYALLPKKVKLLVETPQGNISRFVAGLLTAYANHLQYAYGWEGPVTQGRYKSWVVEPGEHVLALSRWIHLSPVWEKKWLKKPMGQRRAELKRYRWSSYKDYTSAQQGPIPVVADPVLRSMKARVQDRRRKYASYVDIALAHPDTELAAAMYRAPLGIGSPKFVEGLQRGVAKQARDLQKGTSERSRKAQQRKRQQEVLKMATDYFGISMKDLVRRRRRDAIKPVMAALLTRHAGLTQAETAKILGVSSGAAVCVQLRRLQGENGAERRRDLERIERRLKRGG